MTLSWKLLGWEFASNFIFCPLDFVHKLLLLFLFLLFFLKRTMIMSKLRGPSGMWMSSKVCSLCRSSMTVIIIQ